MRAGRSGGRDAAAAGGAVGKGYIFFMETISTTIPKKVSTSSNFNRI